MSQTAKQRVLICKELVSFCDRLLMEIGSRQTPLLEILAQYEFRYLRISPQTVIGQAELYTALSDEDNRAVTEFLRSLGKSDSQTQKEMIDSFKEYMKNEERVYDEAYRKNARLYLAFGFFGGLLLSLLLI